MTDSAGQPPAALSPFACSRRVRAMLPRMRERRGLSDTQLAAAMAWPPSKVLRQESSGLLEPGDALALVARLSVSRDEAVVFLAAVDGARRPEWWEPFASSLDSGARHLLSHEAASSAIRHFGTRIPALVQTAGRYRAAPSLPLLPGTGDDIAERIHAGRRQLVATDGQLSLHVVLDEAALWRTVGGLDVHLDQLDHLTELQHAGRVTIGILPLTHGAHRAVGTPAITLFDLPPADPGSLGCDVVRGHVNTLGIPVMRTEAGWVRDGEVMFDDVCRAALGPDVSLKAIGFIHAQVAAGGGYTPLP